MTLSSSSLDGSCAVEDHLQEGQCGTALSIVDQHIGCPDSSHFNTMILLDIAWQYSMPKTLGAEPTPRSRHIVVISRPYISPDEAGEKYKQYCWQSLMQHKPREGVTRITCTLMNKLMSQFSIHFSHHTEKAGVSKQW